MNAFYSIVYIKGDFRFSIVLCLTINKFYNILIFILKYWLLLYIINNILTLNIIY